LRQRVEEMMRLLAAKKSKLKAIETSIDKKADVMEKVESMIGRKERVLHYIEKQKLENSAFGKKLNDAND